jgi:plasmid maintenance system antidote protein VapI
MSHTPRRSLTKSRLGPHFSEGSRLLWGELEGRELTQADAEDELECARGTVSRLLYGTRRCGLDLALVVLAKFGIPIVAWREEPSEDFVLPACREAS